MFSGGRERVQCIGNECVMWLVHFYFDQKKNVLAGAWGEKHRWSFLC